MESHSLLPSNNIKLEPDCEAYKVQNPTREIISEVQVFDKMDSNIPASVKIEQPEVYANNPGEDTKIYPSSQSCTSLQEQSQIQKVFDDKDSKLVKHDNNQASRMPEDTTLVPRREESLTGTENGCAALQHEHCSHMSQNVSSIIKALIDSSCNAQRIQAGDTPHTSDVRDVTINVDTFLHRRKKTDTAEKPYKCDICSVAFIRIRDLKHHVRVHTGEKPYKCDVCDVCFTQASNLRCHMRTHTGEKPYKCDVCAVSFALTSGLKRHKRTHTGERPYKCFICAASFTHTDNLKCHIRTHTGEKPYKCDICAASFALTGSLKRHMRTHTGEKPYKCDVCAATYSLMGSLKRHMRTHTENKSSPSVMDLATSSLEMVGKCPVDTTPLPGDIDVRNIDRVSTENGS